MPQGLQFQSLQDSLARLPQVIQSIPDIVRDPAANPLQAAILLSMIVVVVLVVLLSVILIFLRPSPEDETLLYADVEGETEVERDARIAAAKRAQTVATKPPRQPMSWLTVASLIVLLIGVVWVVTGITTSTNDVCRSCHADTVHDSAKVGDPHKNVQCVACHETGGPVARATVNLAVRAEHVILGRNESALARDYGKPVASDACMRCHKDQISHTTINVAQQVKVSHTQPLAAGAQCNDCHVLTDGIVSGSAVGMTPCLRCHNGKTAKADCPTCHIGDPTRAMAPVDPATMANAQVTHIDCGVCHFDQTRCNNCHGLKMPHDPVFMAYGHAREGAISIWFGNRKPCIKCHYPGHNNCQQDGCHLNPFPSHPSPTWAKLHQVATWTDASTACSCHMWNPFDHNGVTFCQICHPAAPPYHTAN